MTTTVICAIVALIAFVIGVISGTSINKVRVESAELNESRLRQRVSVLEENVTELESRNKELDKKLMRYQKPVDESLRK